jgi:hypothetical protein
MSRIKSEKVKSEMQDLKKIVEGVFEVSLMDKKRLMTLVDARMVFSKILRDRGHTFVSIAKFLKKDHTTIMNYMDKVVYLLKQDDRLFENYMICKDSFLENRDEVIDEIKDKDLHMKIARVNIQLDKLISERNQVFEMDRKNKRFKYIIELLNKRVPAGREAHIENKIMQLLNE